MPIADTFRFRVGWRRIERPSNIHDRHRPRRRAIQ